MNMNPIKQLFVALFLLASAGTATAAQWQLKKTDLNAAGSKDTLVLGVYGNSFAFSSFQVDFTLPEGVLPTGAPRLGDMVVDHALTYRQEEGSFRCVVYSVKNTEMRAPEGDLLYIPVELAASFKEGAFAVKNGILSNKRSEAEPVADRSVTISAYKEKADLVVDVSNEEIVLSSLDGKVAELRYTTIPDGKALTVAYFTDDSCKVAASEAGRRQEGLIYARLSYAGDDDYNPFERVYVMSLTNKKAIATTGITPPTAAPIKAGQLLSSSLLTGGSVTDGGYAVAGTFAWTDGGIAVPAGKRAYSVTFYPDNSAYYATATTSVEVEVAQTYTITAVASTGGIVNLLGKTEDNKYVSGQTVSLKAIALPNYKFDGWSVVGSEETLGSADSLSVTADADKTYSANFSPIRHEVSIALEGNGTLSVTEADGEAVASGAALQQGTVLQIIATPDMNAQLKALTIDGDSLKGDKVTLTKPLAIKAVFEAKPVEKALVTIEKTAHGSIILYNAQGAPIASGSTVDKNAKVKPVALPDAGYQLAGGTVSLSGVAVEVGTEYTVTGDINATGTFEGKTYKVTAAAVSSNPNETKPAGTITLEPSGEQPYGTEVRIASIEGQAGARLLTILANGKEIAQNEVLTVTGDLTVTAVFDHRVDIEKRYILWPFQTYYYNGVSRNFVPFASQTYAGFSFDVQYKGTDNAVSDKAIDADTYTVLLHRDEDGLYNEFNAEYEEGLVIKKSKIAVTEAPTSSSGNPSTRPSADEVTIEKSTTDGVTKYVIEPKSDTAKKNYEGTVYYFSENPKVALNFGGSILRADEEPKGSVRVTNGGLALEKNADETNFSINAGITVTLEAIPAEGYKFSRWSDGNTENPRAYVVTADAEGVTPEFVGKSAPSYALAIARSVYNGTAQTVAVTGDGNAACQVTFFFDAACQQPAVLKNAGTYYVRVYRPEDADYAAYDKTFEYTIEPADATVTWPTASDILSGHTLAESVLQGGHAGIVAGTFAWSEPAAVMTADGSREVIFTPTDQNYKPRRADVSVKVLSGVSTPTDPEGPTDPTTPTDPTDPEKPTGVESVEEGMRLYADNLSILANMPRQATLTVVNVAGIVIYRETIAGEVTIPVGQAGVYLVRCEVPGESFVKKIVVH